MNTARLNDWLGLIANVAVIGGMVFLAIEIRQNNELLRSESRQALVTNDVTSLAANLDHADVFARLVSGAALAQEEQLRLSFMWALDLRNREFEYLQYINGSLDEATWQSYRQVVLVNHSTGPGRRWWNEIGRRIVDPGFAQSVDDLLKEAQPDDTYSRMASWATTVEPAAGG